MGYFVRAAVLTRTRRGRVKIHQNFICDHNIIENNVLIFPICIPLVFRLYYVKAMNGFVFVAEDTSNLNKSASVGKGPLWKQGVEVMSQISTWIVVPIVGALIFGKMLDRRYGTEPKIFLTLTAIAFVVTCFGIGKIARDYIKKIKREEEKNKNK